MRYQPGMPDRKPRDYDDVGMQWTSYDDDDDDDERDDEDYDDE